MANNNTVETKSDFIDDPNIPLNKKLPASQWNQVAIFQKTPVQQITGSLDDTDIIIDGTKNYNTTIVETTASRTITANALGHLQGNSIKQRYQFDIDCTITLTNFDNTGNNTGTITPIPAGAYDFIFFSNRNGVNVFVDQNIERTKLDKVDASSQTINSNVAVIGNTIAFTATPNFGFTNGNVQKMIVTGTITSLSISNELDSGSYRIFLQQDGTGGHTIPTPDASFGTQTDSSVLAPITTENDVNIYDIAIDPDGITYYSIETITA